MPDQHLTQAEVVDLVAFLDWVRHIDTNGWPPTQANPVALPGTVMPGRVRLERNATVSFVGCRAVR